ncbi:MAG: rubrerythrin [Clostridia bacterium]|nr:rubrerythrin [Clostridia bacterium]
MMKNIEFAINMELEGVKFYTKQAELNKDNSLYGICSMLADEENHHAQMLIDSSKNNSFKLSPKETAPDKENVFRNISDKELQDLGQLDFYKLALEKEKESIILYKDFLDDATEPSERLFFEYMVDQEQHHYNILDNIVVMLQNSEEWVESAEFGVRKEY